MKELSICIPNYNRLYCLKELVDSIISQIKEYNLHDDIEICISDDNSKDTPDEYINQIQRKYPNITIIYHKNDKNYGMDYNFCKSVEISNGTYNWIMGNDDVLVEGSLKNVVEKLKSINQNIDIIVTPFESYDYWGNLLNTFYPIKNTDKKIFDTNNKKDRAEYFYNINHDCGLFAFLSSIIFKHKRWIDHGDMFKDKMNSIFIQIYMHLQTIMDGAIIWYLDEFITKNRMELEEQVANIDELHYKITTGLYNVIDYFFDADLKKHLWEVVVAPWPYRRMLSSDLEIEKKLVLLNFQIESIKLLKQIFIFKTDYCKKLKNKQIIIFGTGSVALKAVKMLQQESIPTIAYCDNNKELWGKEKEGLKILSPNELIDVNKDDTVIIIASSYYVEIYNQIKKYGDYIIYVIV